MRRKRPPEWQSRLAVAEDPGPGAAGMVQCPRCGHLVDPKRMQFHLQRVHGVPLPGRDTAA